MAAKTSHDESPVQIVFGLLAILPGRTQQTGDARAALSGHADRYQFCDRSNWDWQVVAVSAGSHTRLRFCLGGALFH